MEKNQWRDRILFSVLPTEIAFDVLIGALIGYYLDKHFSTQPWLLIVFILFGVGAAVKAVMRDVKKYQESLKDQGPKDMGQR